MFGHLLNSNNLTGTRSEKQVRNFFSRGYDRASDRASDAYDTAMDSGRSWRDYLANWHCHSAQHHDESYHALLNVGTGLFCFFFGAGLMYYFDPQTGRRRRAMVRDKFYSLGRQAARSLNQERVDL